MSRRNPTEQEQKLTAISQKYPEVSWGDPVIPLESLAEVFASGSIDVDEINAHLLAHPLIADPAALPAWRRLWSWHELNQTDYADTRRALLADLAARAYVDPAVILHAAGVVRSLAGANDRLLGRRDIGKYFSDYIDDVVAAGTLQTGGKLFDFDPSGAFGLGFKTEDDQGFDDIKRTVRRGVDKAIAAKMVLEAPALLIRLGQDSDAYASLYEYGLGPDAYGAVAVLACAPVKDFAQLLVNDGRPNDRLFSSLVERYERAPGLRLAVEEAWTKSLRKQLDKLTRRTSQPHKHLLSLRIGYYFEKIEAAFASIKARASSL
jgi:hypothetical protein